MTAVLLACYSTRAAGPDLRSPSGPLTDWKMEVSLFDFWLRVQEPACYSILPFISLPRLNRHIVIQALIASTPPHAAV